MKILKNFLINSLNLILNTRPFLGKRKRRWEKLKETRLNEIEI
jgi:hypothetical protein